MTTHTLHMVRIPDHETSIAAAKSVSIVLPELHQQVMAAFMSVGPMTDATLENLERFKSYGPSTIRKRRSELFQMGFLVADGKELNSRGKPMIRWAIATQPRSSDRPAESHAPSNHPQTVPSLACDNRTPDPKSATADTDSECCCRGCNPCILEAKPSPSTVNASARSAADTAASTSPAASSQLALL